MQSHRSREGAAPPLVLLICFFFLCGMPRPDAAARQDDLAASSAAACSYGLDESLLQEEVRECLGIPYRRGGSSAAGMDCSGFSKHIYSRLFGVELPHKASEQYRLGILRDTSQEPLRMGDLIFFRKKNIIEHVGIYLSDGKFVHSVGGRGVLISNLENPYWKSLLAGSRRLTGLEGEALGYAAQAHSLADVCFDEQSRLRLRFSVLLQKEWPFPGYPDESSWTTFQGNPSDAWEDPPFLFEVGYQRRLARDFVEVGLSAFWKRSLFEDAVTLFPSTFAWGTSPFGTLETQTVLQSGLRLVSEIDLFQGFQIRPFLTLIEGGVTVGDKRAAWGAVGLEASVMPPVGSYDLSLAVDYGDLVESALYPLHVTGGANELSMSLRFRYRVKDLMRISFAGQHAFGDLSESLPGSAVRGGTPSDLFLLFYLSY